MIAWIFEPTCVSRSVGNGVQVEASNLNLDELCELLHKSSRLLCHRLSCITELVHSQYLTLSKPDGWSSP